MKESPRIKDSDFDWQKAVKSMIAFYETPEEKEPEFHFTKKDLETIFGKRESDILDQQVSEPNIIKYYD